MKLNMKAFGLALVAMFAMSAVAASAASAETTYTAEKYPAVIDATRTQTISEPKEFFETAGAQLVCEGAHFNGEAVEATHELTVTPDYTDHTQGGNCRAGGVLNVTVTENGCGFTFETPEIMGEGESKDHTLPVTIDCPTEPETKAIEVHIRNLFNTANACTVTIHHQTLDDEDPDVVTDRVTAVNNNGHVDISGDVVVDVTIHHNSTLCGGEKGKTTEEKSIYTIDPEVPLTVTAKDNEGNPNPIDIGPTE